MYVSWKSASFKMPALESRGQRGTQENSAFIEKKLNYGMSVGARLDFFLKAYLCINIWLLKLLAAGLELIMHEKSLRLSCSPEKIDCRHEPFLPRRKRLLNKIE